MRDFPIFPVMPKKKEIPFEPMPLYQELPLPPPMPKVSPKEETSERGVVVIEIF